MRRFSVHLKRRKGGAGGRIYLPACLWGRRVRGRVVRALAQNAETRVGSRARDEAAGRMQIVYQQSIVSNGKQGICIWKEKLRRGSGVPTRVASALWLQNDNGVRSLALPSHKQTMFGGEK